MAYEIVLSEQADKDRTAILLYWISRNQSNDYSIKLDQIFRAVFDQLAIYPYLGRKLGIKNFRVKLAKEYLIVYFIQQKIVFIITIWDGRRNPADLVSRLQQ
jgi:plasmid stabilization system protein ParE